MTSEFVKLNVINNFSFQIQVKRIILYTWDLMMNDLIPEFIIAGPSHYLCSEMINKPETVFVLGRLTDRNCTNFANRLTQNNI